MCLSKGFDLGHQITVFDQRFDGAMVNTQAVHIFGNAQL
jgi:hypothetical protein